MCRDASSLHHTHTLLIANGATTFYFPKKHEKWGEVKQIDDTDEKSAESEEKMKGGEEWRGEAVERREEEVSEGPWRYQPRAWLMDTWVCGMACWGRRRECGVRVEVKASSSLSTASDSDETLGFTVSWFLPEGNLRPHASHAWTLKNRIYCIWTHRIVPKKGSQELQ